VLSADWKDMNLTDLIVTSRRGYTCRLKAPGLETARVVDATGTVASSFTKDGGLTFETNVGQTVRIVFSETGDK
jgi:hypothetical protein